MMLVMMIPQKFSKNNDRNLTKKWRRKREKKENSDDGGMKMLRKEKKREWGETKSGLNVPWVWNKIRLYGKKTDTLIQPLHTAFTSCSLMNTSSVTNTYKPCSDNSFLSEWEPQKEGETVRKKENGWERGEKCMMTFWFRDLFPGLH